MKSIESIVGEIESKKMFSEERYSSLICKKMNIFNTKNNSEHHWFNCEESYNLKFTYSKIDVCNIGKNALLIGLNPRDDGENFESRIEDYLKKKKENPSIKYREYLKPYLENTRRNAIVSAYNIENSLIKSLVTLDLFSYRTNKSNELLNKIKNENDKMKFIGELNFKIIRAYINDLNVDYIILGWGNINSNFWNLIPKYKEMLFNLLAKKLDKCYIFGITKNGSPFHPAAHGVGNNLRKITQEELNNMFNKA